MIAGITILYVSHRLDEVITLSDRISVLRDGAVMGTWERGHIDKQQMIERMVGRELNTVLQEIEPITTSDEPVVLKVQNLTGNRFRDISFEVRKGEVLGFAGLVGAGRTEVAEAIFGIHPYQSGTIEVNGEAGRRPKPARCYGARHRPGPRGSQASRVRSRTWTTR